MTNGGELKVFPICSPPPRSSLGVEPCLGAPVRTEVEAVPICRFPSYGKPTWAPYDFCGNTHTIMAGAKTSDSTYASQRRSANTYVELRHQDLHSPRARTRGVRCPSLPARGAVCGVTDFTPSS